MLRKKLKPKRRNRKLTFESLEPRKLLAGVGPTITTFPTRIEIIGTPQDDTVDVYYQQKELVISVGIKHQRKNHITIPAKEAAVIQSIRFDAKNGNDFFHNHTDIPSTAFGGWGFDKLIGGDANDKLYGEQGHDILIGGKGNDTLHGDDRIRTRVGRFDGNDKLYGGPDQDTIYGQGGHDDAHGEGDVDQINGGPGVDILVGGAGGGTIHGNGDADLIIGDDGEDKLHGGGKDDVIFGGRDKDTVWGNAGSDCLFGGREGDTLKGGPDDDYISTGLGGRDIADGETGEDVIYGFIKFDNLKGGKIFEGSGEPAPRNEPCHPDEYARGFTHPNGKYRYINPPTTPTPSEPITKKPEDISADDALYQNVVIDEVAPGSKDLPKGTPVRNPDSRAVIGPANLRLGEDEQPGDEGEDREAKRIRLTEQRNQIEHDLAVLNEDRIRIHLELEYLEFYPKAIDEIAFEYGLSGEELIELLTNRLDVIEGKIGDIEPALAKVNLILSALFAQDENETHPPESEDSGDAQLEETTEEPLYTIVFDAEYNPVFSEEWTTLSPVTLSEEVRHVLSYNTLQIELANQTPMTNPVNPLDVNSDTHFSPIDALFIINRLNNPNSPSNAGTWRYLDTSGDGAISPLDALLVINRLNRKNGVVEGEGESSIATPFIGPLESDAERRKRASLRRPRL